MPTDATALLLAELIGTDLAALVAEAAELVIEHPAVFQAVEDRLVADYPRRPPTGRADRLRQAVEETAGLALVDASDRDAHARRIVLVAALGLFPDSLPLT